MCISTEDNRIFRVKSLVDYLTIQQFNTLCVEVHDIAKDNESIMYVTLLLTWRLRVYYVDNIIVVSMVPEYNFKVYILVLRFIWCAHSRYVSVLEVY